MSARPLLIYDGRCGFCKIWIKYWEQLTAAKVEYAASQDVKGRFPEIPEERYSQPVQLAVQLAMP